MAEGNPPPDPNFPPDPTSAPGTSQDALHPPYPFDDAHAPAGVVDATPPTKRRRRRRWPYVLLAFVLLIGLLVLLAPTLAGTGPVRGVILGQVNQRLNGRVDVADWSMGWRSPVTVSGLKVFDKAGSQVLELPRLTTELNLYDAVRGRLHFGKVTVEGLNALVRRDVQGNINLAQLVPESADAGAADPAAGDGNAKTTLPDVRGELHLVNCRATFEDQLQGQTFFFPSIAGTVKCSDINKAIENALEITCRVGDAPAGKVTLAGKADVAEDNVVSVETMEVDEKLTFDGVELGSFAFALGREGPLDKLAGMTSGSASIRFRGGEGAALEAVVNSTGFTAGGPALKGDTFATQKLSLVVPPTTLMMPSADDWKAWVVRVGSSGGGDRVALTIDQGRVAVGADAKLQALANLAENVVPGTRGRVRADVELDVGALARQMPRVLALQEGLALSAGRFTHSTDLQLLEDRATVRNLEVHLSDVRGTRRVADAIDGAGTGAGDAVQPVSLQPINLVFTGTSFGGGWAGAALRDLNLTLDSGFANAQFKGRDLADLSGKATGDLKRLRDELGQIVDMGDLRLAGPFDVTVASKGDVAAGGNAVLKATAVVIDLVVDGLKDTPALRQKQVWLEAGGEVVRGADGAVAQLRGGRAIFRTGDPNRPTVLADVTATAAFTPAPAPTAAGASTAPAAAVASVDYTVTRLAVDLPRAQAEFGEHVPALKEYAFDRGTLTVTGGGKYNAGAVSYDGAVTVADLTMARTPAPSESNPRPGRVEVLRGYNLTTDAGLTYAPGGDGGAAVDVTKLSLRDDREMLAVAKAGDRPLRLVTTADGRMQPSGRLELRADLKQLSDVNERLAAEVAAAGADDQSAELRSGRLAGTVDFAPAAAGELRIAGNFEGSQLTVTGPQGNALDNERVTVVAQARARDDLSTVTVDKLDVTGGILTANATGTTLQLAIGQGDAARPATTAEMVQSASVKAEVPDLGKLQALLDALATPEAATQSAMLSERAARAGREPLLVPAAQVLMAQARREPPPDQIIGRRPPPARPAPQQPAAQQPAPRQQPVRRDSVAPVNLTAEEAPAPPVKLGGGSASLSLDVRRQGERVVVTPEVTGRNVVLMKGAGRHTLGAVELKTAMSYVPVAPAPVAAAAPRADARAAAAATTEEGPSFAEQIRDLQIPSLTLRGAGSTVSLVEPVLVSDVAGLGQMFAAPDPKQPAAKAAPGDVKAALRAEGDVGQLSALLVALGFIGDPQGEKQPYGGRYALEQRLAAGKDGVAAKGNLNLDDFVVAGGSFSEKAVRFANDVTLDSAKDALSLRNVTLGMESSKALELKLAGNVLDYSTKRRMEKVGGTIGYDWAKIWEIVRPMLSKEQQENLKLRVAGQAQREFALGGSYPAVGDDGRALTFAESIRSLTGHFNGGFQLVEVNGLEVQNLELPLTLRDGRLVVAYHDKPEGQNYPPPADCNSGKLNIGGATVDLAEETPRLTMAKGTKLLENATLNPVFSDMFGGIINNPLFVGTKEARGLMNVTVVQCDRLPLDSLVLKQVRENDGRAEFLFSIREVYLGNSLLLEGLKLAGQSEFADSLQGEIRESRVVIERGQTKQDVTINTGETDRPWRIYGSTALETKRLELTFTIPPQLLRQLGPTGRQAAELLADGLPIPLGGTTRAPQLDLNRALASAVKEGLIPGLLRRATQRGQDDDRQRTETPPARDDRMNRGEEGAGTRPPAGREAPPETEPKAPADPLDGIFDLIKKQREEKEREKDEERARRRQQREQQGGAPAQSGASGSDRIGRQPAR